MLLIISVYNYRVCHIRDIFRLHLSVMASPGEQEFVVRVPPRDDTKKHHVMKFNASLNQEFGNWNNVRMVRENNQKILNQQPQVKDEFLSR